MQIQGAIFDMDGTLVDSLGFWDDFFAFFEERYSFKVDRKANTEILRRFRTIPVHESAVILHNEFGIAESADILGKELTDLLELLYRTRVECKPGVADFLRELSARGVKMCIASATKPRLIRVALDHAGIGCYFSEIVSCEDVGKGKSFPDVFNAALKRLGTPKGATWVFEDSIVALQTAQKAGFHTVGVYDRNNDGQELVAAYSDEYIAAGESICRLL